MIVWIEMLSEDRVADVEALAREMTDPRIQWFHDPKRRAGQSIATSLGNPDKVAWDVYLFFDAHAEWKDHPPTPRQWVHQLDDPWPSQHDADSEISLNQNWQGFSRVCSVNDWLPAD